MPDSSYDFKGIKAHQARMRAIWNNLSGKEINYSKYMTALVELGRHIPTCTQHVKYHTGADLLKTIFPNLNLEQYKKIKEFTEHFQRVWGAKELGDGQEFDRVQVIELDGVKPYYEKGEYRKKDKVCKFLEVKNYSKLPKTSELDSNSAYYIRKGEQLFYSKWRSDFLDHELILVSDKYSELGLTATLKDHQEIDMADLLKIATKTSHTHLVDQRNFAANFDLNRSTQAEVTQGLAFLNQYYLKKMQAQIEVEIKKDEERKRNEFEGVLNLSTEKNKAIVRESARRKRKREEQKAFEELLELDEKAFNAIQNYTTGTQDVFYGVGWASGILTSILIGFVQGGNSLFTLLDNLSLVAKSLLSFVWGGFSTGMQWAAYRKRTASIVMRYHGKDGHFEGLLRYHSRTGIRLLSTSDLVYLTVASFFVGLTSIGMGALAYNSLYNLPVFLGIFGSFAIPPLGFSIIVLFAIAVIAYNSIYMFMEGYEKLLKQDKGLIDYLIKNPFNEICQYFDNDKTYNEGWQKDGMKVLTCVVFLAFFFIGVGGLVISGMTMSHSIAKLSDNVLNSGALFANALSKLVGVVSAISRFIFTMGRGNDTAKALMNPKNAEIDKGKLALAFAGGIQAAVFFYSEDPLGQGSFDALGGSLAGSREIAGQVGGIVRFKEASHRECDFFEMTKVPTSAMLKQLPGANAAYIVIREEGKLAQLYYINKNEQKCERVKWDPVHEKALCAFAIKKLRVTQQAQSLSAFDRRDLAELLQNHQRAQDFQDYPLHNCALIFMNLRELNLDTIKSLVQHHEAYIRVTLRQNGHTEERLLYLKNSTITDVRFNKDFAKNFDKRFAKKMQEGLQAKALTAENVTSISKWTHEYLHPTSDAEEFRFERVRQQMKHRFFAPPKETKPPANVTKVGSIYSLTPAK